MQRSRHGLATAWLWALVACAACSGKTAVIGEGTDPGSGGSAVAPAEGGTGGTSTGGRPNASTGGDPGSTGGNSEPATSGALFGCGSESCVEGQSYCYNYTPGTAGPKGRAECRRLTEECADCACLCPALAPDGQCSGSPEDLSASCLCGGEPGKLVISCFGS